MRSLPRISKFPTIVDDANRIFAFILRMGAKAITRPIHSCNKINRRIEVKPAKKGLALKITSHTGTQTLLVHNVEPRPFFAQLCEAFQPEFEVHIR